MTIIIWWQFFWCRRPDNLSVYSSPEWIFERVNQTEGDCFIELLLISQRPKLRVFFTWWFFFCHPWCWFHGLVLLYLGWTPALCFYQFIFPSARGHFINFCSALVYSTTALPKQHLFPVCLIRFIRRPLDASHSMIIFWIKQLTTILIFGQKLLEPTSKIAQTLKNNLH